MALLDYGLATGDKSTVDFVDKSFQFARGYGNTLVGYFPEWLNGGPAETCEVADMVALAVKLSQAAEGDYWDDADRWVRNQFVRIPEWVSPEEAQCRVNAKEHALPWDGRYAIVGEVKPGDVVNLSFPIAERTDTVDIEGKAYTLIRKGNDVVHIDPPGKILPLYQREKYRENRARIKKTTRFVAEQQIDW